MKKLLILIIGLALVLASSCSHNAKTPAKPADSTTPTDTTTPEDSAKPTIKELLENIPTSFEEYAESIKNSSNRSASRSAAEAVALDDNDIKEFTTYEPQEFGDGALVINAFLKILAKDISKLTIFDENKDIAIPNTFSISQQTLTEIESETGYPPESFDDIDDFGTVKVTYDGTTKNTSVFWSFTMHHTDDQGEVTTTPIHMLIKGKFDYTEGIYEELKTYEYDDFGYPEDFMIHYYNDDNKIIKTIDNKAEGYRGKSIMLTNANAIDYYLIDDAGEKECLRQTEQFYASYTADGDLNRIFDKDGYLIAQKEDAKEFYYVPLKYINTNGKTIKKEATGTPPNTSYSYYIDDTPTSNIEYIDFESMRGETFSYPCYKVQGTNLTTDGFTFTKAETYTTAMQQLSGMKQTINSSALQEKFVSDEVFDAFKTECTTWVNGL